MVPVNRSRADSVENLNGGLRAFGNIGEIERDDGQNGKRPGRFQPGRPRDDCSSAPLEDFARRRFPVPLGVSPNPDQ